ncbi:unnamed protein product [Pleuronectes platessa]|uniref:Uncharacterized protein n=1 Tax=Pleuronectes platessa TaxID=8262 RepID=A0A9N7V9N9_PLEPL|nr:unnamed protein product [Pleuronectes platessa]
MPMNPRVRSGSRYDGSPPAGGEDDWESLHGAWLLSPPTPLAPRHPAVFIAIQRRASLEESTRKPPHTAELGPALPHSVSVLSAPAQWNKSLVSSPLAPAHLNLAVSSTLTASSPQ